MVRATAIHPSERVHRAGTHGWVGESKRTGRVVPDEVHPLNELRVLRPGEEVDVRLVNDVGEAELVQMIGAHPVVVKGLREDTG